MLNLCLSDEILHNKILQNKLYNTTIGCNNTNFPFSLANHYIKLNLSKLISIQSIKAAAKVLVAKLHH